MQGRYLHFTSHFLQEQPAQVICGNIRDTRFYEKYVSHKKDNTTIQNLLITLINFTKHCHSTNAICHGTKYGHDK